MTSRDQLVRALWATTDCAVVVLASYIAAWIRYDLSVEHVATWPLAMFAITAALIHLVLGTAIGPYRVGHLRGSFDETADVARTSLALGVILAVLVLLTPLFAVPRSLPIAVPVFSLVGMFTLRFIVRTYRWGRAAVPPDVTKVLVFGAGEGGRQLVRALRRDETAKYEPIALLDDDPRKRRLKIEGVPVRGSRAQLATLAEQSGATALIVAMPSADADLVREVREQARAVNLDVLVLPPVQDLIDPSAQGSARAQDLRELNLEDLLGRRQVELDETSIRAAITGKTVVVTGAGGSIGSELARQISRFEPRRLLLLDRDESALHAVQMSLTGRALLDDDSLALIDIRDWSALRSWMGEVRPDVVFHAAAHKHLTLLERHPLEAWKTNVLGTLQVLQAAHETGVQTFVNISTDKAANPTCVLGYSKRLAERLTADFAGRGQGTYVSVRFGNVLGSRGSVIPTFTSQIEHGGPVTVTHPDVERYFMLIPEACQLVLQAATMAHQGDALVLAMGNPVKIVDVARTLIDLSGKDEIEIVYTGLRPGEKLTEELFAPTDRPRPSEHPMVSSVEVPSLQPQRALTANLPDGAAAFEWMRREASADVRIRGVA